MQYNSLQCRYVHLATVASILRTTIHVSEDGVADILLAMMTRMHQTLHGLVDTDRHANNTAVIYDNGEAVSTVNYCQMQEAAECITLMLRHVRCGEGHVVGLFYEQSVMLPSCILG